jgi:spore coat protein U-like protein
MKLSKTVLSVLSIAIIGILALGLTSTPAFASTTTGTIAVTATVTSQCTLSTTGLSFGTYYGAVTNATAILTINCGNGIPYTVGLDGGSNGGTEGGTLYMLLSGTTTLGYAVFQDAAHNTPWGNTTSNWLGQTGSGSNQNINVYGQIPAGTPPAFGNYSDTIHVTINY